MRLRKAVSGSAGQGKQDSEPARSVPFSSLYTGEEDWGPLVGGGRGFKFKTKFVLNAGDQWAAMS